MRNAKTLTATILLGMGVLLGGCGSQTAQPTMQANNQQTKKGISLIKAIDLAKKGQFTPQKVQFDGYTTSKVFGDEPEIIVTSRLDMGGCVKYVKIHITDADVIKRVAKAQDDRQNKYINGTGTVDAHEIVFGDYGNIEVK
nr:MAG TPA: lipoprotein [Bacteriophage sp.]